MYFDYGEQETEYLKNSDRRLCEIINKFGHINHEVNKDIFCSIAYLIIGQQISTKAQQAIWKRVTDSLECVNAESVIASGTDCLHSCGVSYRKAEYIMECALKIKSGEFDLTHIAQKTDEEAVKELTKLKGIGVWTAEILLLFCFMRKNIFCYDDLGIQKGLRIVYNHKKITKELFEKYRKRFSPYCSVASLYLWAAADDARVNRL